MYRKLFLVGLLTLPVAARGDISRLGEVVVYGHQQALIGQAVSASEGVVGAGEIAQRPVLRSGEILEFVPGMVVTQHSGSGKANQYFLRGFNLDHGTDFRTQIDGMPINMRTHGHGQGYTDLNFIIPEFVQHITYQKGPYHAEDGDFSTAGSASFHLASRLDASRISAEFGEDAFARVVAGGSFDVGGGQLLLGLEGQQYDGPWSDIDEDVGKTNILLRYSEAIESGEWSMTLMGYDNSWQSADQIPQRAIDQGLIDRLGSLDTTVGGDSSRYSLSTNWRQRDWQANAYAISSDLNLFSNFTYFLEDPVNGDQFQQVDDRNIYGGSVSKQFELPLGNTTFLQQLGVQLRYDDIDQVGLYNTAQRQRLGTVREDVVEQLSIGVFWEGEWNFGENWLVDIGARYDWMDVDVRSDLAANSGSENDGLVSLKGGLRYTFSEQLEGYFNLGQSHHSNDARGATIAVDPVSGEAATPVDLLVRGEGAELGLRYRLEDKLNLSFALWGLELDSELLFVGDAGNTEASRASRRWGAELAAYYWLDDALALDVELAWTRSRFREDAIDEGNRIEGSLPFVASAGVTWKPTSQWQTALRVRHFGPRTLDSFGAVESDTFSVVNWGNTVELGQWQLGLDVLNLLDSNDHDIDYFYESRLMGEPAGGVLDNHFHPIEPRTVRVQFQYRF